jgi:hypothetical protein
MKFAKLSLVTLASIISTQNALGTKAFPGDEENQKHDGKIFGCNGQQTKPCGKLDGDKEPKFVYSIRLLPKPGETWNLLPKPVMLPNKD